MSPTLIRPTDPCEGSAHSHIICDPRANDVTPFMLADCFQKECDVPVLLSNDSDLAEPLKYIKTTLEMPVGLITPAHFFVAKLKRYSFFSKKISDEQLKTAQFRLKLKDDDGEFSCPKDWL